MRQSFKVILYQDLGESSHSVEHAHFDQALYLDVRCFLRQLYQDACVHLILNEHQIHGVHDVHHQVSLSGDCKWWAERGIYQSNVLGYYLR